MSVSAAFPLIRARHESLTRQMLRDVFKDQEAHVVVAGRSLGDEWDAPLARAIYTRNRNTAADIAGQVAKRLGGKFDPDLIEAWITNNAEIAAVSINQATRDALDGSGDKASVFAVLLGSRLAQYAASMVTTAANFGAQDGAKQGGATSKTWVSSGGPRHAGMNGQTVGLDDNFSNGMAWPGDPDGGAEEVANCRCSVGFD